MTATPTYAQMDDALRERDRETFEKNVSNTDIVKASKAAAIVVQQLYDRPERIQVPKDREGWLNLYRRHVWTYAGIFAIASTAAKLRVDLVKIDRRTRERETILDHLAPQLMEYPNPEMTGYDHREMLFIRLESCGNAYDEIAYEDRTVRAGKKPVSSKSSPIELWPIRPDYLKPAPRKGGHGIDHWVFQVRKGTRKTNFPVEKIVPYGYADPVDPWFGMGSLRPALTDIQSDEEMANWNLDFFANGLAPQGVFRTDQVLQPWEAEDVAAQIREFLLGKGRKVLVLGKNLQWEMVSTNPKDVDWLGGRSANRESVLASLGVPPVKVGLLEHAKYDNYGLQAEAFHRDTILPKLRKVEGSWGLYLVPRFPDLERTPETDWKLEFDTDELLAEDQDKLSARVINELRCGLLTLNEALEELGRDAIEDEAVGNLRFVDTRMTTLDQAVGAESASAETALEKREDEVLSAIAEMEDNLDERIRDIVRTEMDRIKVE